MLKRSLKSTPAYALLPLLLMILAVTASGSVMAQAPPMPLPPVTNVQAADGSNPGEVVITWDAAPEATYYRIGYVNMVTDYPVAQARGDWQEAFIYVDIANRGQTSYTISRLEPGTRHAFSVLTNASRYGEPTWPSDPRWVFLTVAGRGPTPFSEPTGLAAVSGPEAGEVTLTWAPVAGAALHLVWSARPDGTDSRWHDADAGSAVISGLEAGLEYSFAIIAGFAASSGEVSRWSGFSNRVRAIAQAAPAPEAAATAIAAGGTHTCMLQDDDAAVCWGANGDADKGQADDPPPEVSFTAITAGYEHTCGITANGEAICWGDNSSGQTGAPPEVSFTAITAGYEHTCALRTDDGAAQCWGSNEYGQLNAPAGASFTAITAGGEHSCGLRSDGRVECWGDNYFQQSTPPDSLFYAVSAGRWHTCGITRDGSIACWGANPDGQAPAEVEVPYGTAEGSYQAVSAGNRSTCAVTADFEAYCWGDGGLAYPYPHESFHGAPVSSVSVGDEHICWLKVDGTVNCRGGNRYGQSAPPSSETFASVSSGRHNTCGVRTDGAVACWGGVELGLSSTPPEGSFQSVSAGGYHSCGIRNDGAVICWGENRHGQAFPPRATFQSVSAGSFHTCGVRTGGMVACWGNNERGQAMPPEGSFQSVSAGYFHTCGVRTGGMVACWGKNEHGQATPPEGSFQSVSTGHEHACGVRTNGAMVCWGSNFHGETMPPEGMFHSVSSGWYYTCGVQLGDKTAVCWGGNDYGKATPPKGEFQSISAGTGHACGVRTDGRVVCWGENDTGQASPLLSRSGAPTSAINTELYDLISPPMAPAYMDWRWGSEQDGFREIVTDFTIHNDVGDWSDEHGYYPILIQSRIAEVGFYLGVQTDANRRGKALIYSRWGTRDLANARISETDGWTESYGHEGDFIGVRRAYDWGAGNYRVRIAPDGLEDDGEWFGLWITDLGADETTKIGSLKFPLTNDVATILPHSSATIELYGNPQVRPIDIPQWHVSVARPWGDGNQSDRGFTSYPYDDSDNALFNSDVRYDHSEGRAHLIIGGMTERSTREEVIDFR